MFLLDYKQDRALARESGVGVRSGGVEGREREETSVNRDLLEQQRGSPSRSARARPL